MADKETFTVADGKELILFARENIEFFLKNNKRMAVPDFLKEKYKENFGAFVTLNTYGVKDNSLRGCIGYIEPRFALYDVIHKVSVSSATEDTRFSSVSVDEMEDITIEISILTPPKIIEVSTPNDYLEKIVIGRDGLIVERGMRRGLLLPQVPVDHNRNWDVETFLNHTCGKAWLSSDAWKDVNGTKIFSFQAIVFEEKTPRGEVVRKYLSPI
jgi:uncharacterized protein (TIGR00296 family)